MKNLVRLGALALAIGVALAAPAKSKTVTLYYGEDGVIEPGDTVSFSLDTSEFPDEIGDYEVLSEYLPTDVTVEWTGKKFKPPKSAKPKVKKIDGEYEIVVSEKGENNPSGLKVSYNKKKGIVSGSFKVYASYETKKGKLKIKSYSAKFSGGLGDEGVRVTIKKVGSFDASIE